MTTDNMGKDFRFQFLSVEHIDEIMPLISSLNPTIDQECLRDRMLSMLQMDYLCFGLYQGQRLLGLCGAWTTVRLYCGKQLELDNLVVSPESRSLGVGEKLIDHILAWAKDNAYDSCELNTYVVNDKSHKFYFNQGFNILGYHFFKEV